jgi:hypothetical protein
MVGILYFELLYKKITVAMKFVLSIMLICFAFACQKEELKIIGGDESEAYAMDQQLKGLVVSVVAHDGSFDDVVDRSSCFSIDFPYTCLYNGHQYPMNNLKDLEPWTKGDMLVPVFPVSITFANHIQAEVPNNEAFINLIERCANGELFDDIIGCVDLVYPISIAVYNSDSSNFETIIFNHDRETFENIIDFDENTLVSMNYPIQIKLENEVVLTIDSNEILKSQILDRIPFCE